MLGELGYREELNVTILWYKKVGAVYSRLIESYIFESISLSPFSPKHSVR